MEPKTRVEVLNGIANGMDQVIQSLSQQMAKQQLLANSLAQIQIKRLTDWSNKIREVAVELANEISTGEKT